MKKTFIAILIIGLLFSVVNFVHAAPTEWHNNPSTDTDIGEVFELRFEILSDETTNYTITINPGTKFSAVDDNNSMTLEIPKDETRTFIFNMKIEEELEDGKHVIYYDAFKSGVSFKSDKAYVRAGQQAPGFELIVLISAVVIVAVILKRRSK